MKSGAAAFIFWASARILFGKCVTLAFQQQNDLAYIRQVHGSLGRLSVHSQDTSLTGNISEEAALLSGESKLAAALDERWKFVPLAYVLFACCKLQL